jgi:hypothetical protein
MNGEIFSKVSVSTNGLWLKLNLQIETEHETVLSW